MKASDIPRKFTVPFAASAGGDKRVIPDTSQIGITDGAASLPTGFPPLNFLPLSSGGVPPFGQDVNGILFESTSWDQWYSAGGPVKWDSSFSATISGYPLGALVASATTPGLYWISTADDNATNPDTGGSGWDLALIPSGHGQCLLSVTSTILITLAPYGGNRLRIGGPSFPIPAAGVTAAPTGVYVNGLSGHNLAANTAYYVAAAMIAGTMTLGFFAAGTYSHMPDTTAANLGVEVPSLGGTPQSAWTLVGMVQTNGSTQFVRSITNLSLINWFNRQPIQLLVNIGSTGVPSGPSLSEISAGLRLSALVWGDGGGAPSIDSGGYLTVITAGANCAIQTYVDGATPVGNAQVAGVGSLPANFPANFSSPANSSVTEGFHTWELWGASNLGTTNLTNGYMRGQIWG